jgi:hypothetical protein
MARRASLRQFLTNLDQPMPLPEKARKLTRPLATSGVAPDVLWAPR